MLHYTLNTGHTRESPRSEVRDDVIKSLQGLLAPGEHTALLPAGYRLVVPVVSLGYFATVYQGQRPLCSLAVAKTEAEAESLWPDVERHYHSLTELPGIRAADFALAQQPAETPWVTGVVIWGTANELFWIADFERCLAWAWCERH